MRKPKSRAIGEIAVFLLTAPAVEMILFKTRILKTQFLHQNGSKEIRDSSADFHVVWSAVSHWLERMRSASSVSICQSIEQLSTSFPSISWRANHHVEPIVSFLEFAIGKSYICQLPANVSFEDKSFGDSSRMLSPACFPGLHQTTAEVTRILGQHPLLGMLIQPDLPWKWN